MITYIEKGYGLHTKLLEAGFVLGENNSLAFTLSGEQSSAIDIEVQEIINNFDPLPDAQAAAIEKVNAAAGEARKRYISDIPSQDATYQLKLEDAKAFKEANYPENDLVNYKFINQEADALASTGKDAADLIIDTAENWINLSSIIEGLRRKGNISIEAQEDWKQCNTVADLYKNSLAGI